MAVLLTGKGGGSGHVFIKRYVDGPLLDGQAFQAFHTPGPGLLIKQLVTPLLDSQAFHTPRPGLLQIPEVTYASWPPRSALETLEVTYLHARIGTSVRSAIMSAIAFLSCLLVPVVAR